MIYKSIVGSHEYGLADDDSDIDVAIVTDGVYDITEFPHLHHPPFVKSSDMFKTACYIPSKQGNKILPANYLSHPWVYQWFFPYAFCINNELTQWIVENREDLMRAQLPEIYHAYMQLASQWAYRAHSYYTCKGAKRIMYAIHFRNMMYNYAEGMTFAEATVASGDVKDFLLSVRRGEAPLKLVLQENAKARERAKSVEKFYREPKVDFSVIDEFRHTVDKVARSDENVHQ